MSIQDEDMTQLRLGSAWYFFRMPANEIYRDCLIKDDKTWGDGGSIHWEIDGFPFGIGLSTKGLDRVKKLIAAENPQGVIDALWEFGHWEVTRSLLFHLNEDYCNRVLNSCHFKAKL